MMVHTDDAPSPEAGFTLIETLIAMGILATGLLSLAGVFASGMSNLAGSSATLLMREKAREAVESVHTARDTRVIAWNQISNVADGGVFLSGPQPLRLAGDDGLINTADDALAPLETTLLTGPDNLLGTADDVAIPLSQYTRQVDITPLVTGGVTNPTLRQLQVTLTYTTGNARRTYTLTTYISSIS
jgi:prepilin-type N-terminal cleavage/methylation domain-containing protein